METCHGVRLLSSTVIDGRKVPVSNYYVGPGKACSKPHQAACMTEALANLLVAKLNNTGHHAEVCELLCDENSTIHDTMVSIGEEAAPVVVPTSLQELSKSIEKCSGSGRHRAHSRCYRKNVGWLGDRQLGWPSWVTAMPSRAAVKIHSTQLLSFIDASLAP
jgi:hypothetical protein